MNRFITLSLVILAHSFAGTAKATQRPKLGGKTVAGWRPDNHCKLAVGDGLVVTTTGDDPHLSHQLAKPLPKGKFALRIRLSSTAAGQGQFFWREEGVRPPFFPDRSVTVKIMHDGKPRDYVINFETKRDLTAIRLDPATAVGEIHITSMSLHSADDTKLYELPVSAERMRDRAADKRPNIIMVFADDWGYGDLGAHKHLTDLKTPHLDALSSRGVLFSDAYITAPQCSPSRAGLMTGRYQQRFGFDTIPDNPLPLDEPTIAERLRRAGYTTGMVGKWHLEPNAVSLKWAQEHQPDGIRNNRVTVRRDLSMQYWPQARGFDEFFKGELNPYWSNFDLSANDLASTGEVVRDKRFRVDVQTEAGLAFIERNFDKPFFLYLAHYAPHVPLEASEKYLGRFPGDMPERRRTGLAMMNAVDEGVGRIAELLRDRGIADNTLIMFTSDNGAPLGAQTGQPMADILPVGKPGPAWDGSRNDPLAGEKGMVAEGGIRVPMIWSWPARLPKGTTITEPVISLDMTATALAVAGVKESANLDGENLIAWLSDPKAAPPQRDLFWRFWSQGAVRSGDWKYILTGDGREMLFNIRNDKEEQNNLIANHGKLASQLKAKLNHWTSELKPAGLPTRPLNDQELRWYDYYFTETH